MGLRDVNCFDKHIFTPFRGKSQGPTDTNPALSLSPSIIYPECLRERKQTDTQTSQLHTLLHGWLQGKRKHPCNLALSIALVFYYLISTDLAYTYTHAQGGANKHTNYLNYHHRFWFSIHFCCMKRRDLNKLHAFKCSVLNLTLRTGLWF